MSADRRRAAQYVAERDELFATWMAGAVRPYSAALRPELERAGGRRAVRRPADLSRMPVVSLAHLGDGRAYVLEPDVDAVAGHGPLGDRMRLAVADLLGRRRGLARNEVEPGFKPVVWTTFLAGDDPPTSVFVANTTTDLDRLTELGRRGLSISGVRSDDRVLVVDPAGAGLAPWQFLAGARDAGVATLHLDRRTPRSMVATAVPTVVAGGASSLVEVVTRGLPGSVRLLVVNDGNRPTPEQAETLAGSGRPVAEWWVPAGARAAWVRCPGGTGFHTWPTTEVVEIVDGSGAPASAGRLVWSPVGWNGSVWLRLDTGVRAKVVDQTCPTCGRTTPRVVPAPVRSASGRDQSRLTVRPSRRRGRARLSVTRRTR